MGRTTLADASHGVPLNLVCPHDPKVHTPSWRPGLMSWHIIRHETLRRASRDNTKDPDRLVNTNERNGVYR
ncbi:hypothetical protein TWF225_000634 [Orbilia oligospora]|nr:hypothetical protein TWF225_000634 [Orbilia oligospora]KAF3240374.1 hypothetical protein TWF217_000837 [Orbilia oligospora]